MDDSQDEDGLDHRTMDTSEMTMTPKQTSMFQVPSQSATATRVNTEIQLDSRVSTRVEIPTPLVKEGHAGPGGKPRPCRDSVVPFDTEKSAEIFIRLESLKNLEETEDLPRAGEYVVRIICMGQVYGHFPSGAVDMQSMAYYARNEKNRRNPDIFLQHEFSLCIRFRELVDNPIVFQLCQGGDVTPDAYSSLPPIGFICLDVARILNYRNNSILDHQEPWIMPQSGFNNAIAPILQLSLDCLGGLPETSQLLQGNMMTIECESLHSLPFNIQQQINNQEGDSEVQMYMTLPHSRSDPVVRFPGGKLKSSVVVEPTFRKHSVVDEATQTNDPGQPEGKRGSTDIEGPKEPRHWASVKELVPDMPLEATAMDAEALKDPLEADGDTEIFGDGRDDFIEFGEVGDTRLVWNSFHRKYIPVDCYRNMLMRLSQNTIWPVEISIALKKKNGSKKTKSTSRVSITEEGGGANDRQIMAELGRPSQQSTSSKGGPNPDLVLIWHAVAFVDLSCLVNPGIKFVRFACRMTPFSNELLHKKTCVGHSAVPEALLLATIKERGSNQNMSRSLKSQHSKSIIKERASTIGMSRKSQYKITEGGSEAEVNKEPQVERVPFITFKIFMLRSIVPCYKTSEISKVVDDFLPRRQLTRRKIANASAAEQKYKRAVLEAAAELSHEFSEHYWKEVLQHGQNSSSDQAKVSPSSCEAIKKGFLFYLNASGRYLILREHLRGAISNLVQQKCLNMRPSGFHNHRDFQAYLHDMYVYLVDEMHEILNSATLQETDPLRTNLDRLLQQTNCGKDQDLSKAALHQRQITDLGIFAEEAFAQGDFESCHKLHLQRTCKDRESARCWTEFAIMWLSKGDDRMAEIAVREALRKDPLYLYALLISGIISVRHGDERGLECLGAALGLRPMAPEIMVIIGVANSLIGNEIAADYFFRKAAHVHRVITGQSTEDLEKTFTDHNLKKPFNMKQFIKDLDGSGNPARSESAANLKKTATKVVSSTSKNVLQEPLSPGKEESTMVPKTHSKKISKVGYTKDSEAIKNIQSAADANAADDSLKKRKSSMKKKQSGGSINQGKDVPVQAPPPPSEPAPSRFTFPVSSADIQLEEVELPILNPSIQSPWDVTEFSEKMQRHLATVAYLNGSATPKKVQSKSKSMFNVISPDDGVAPDSQIREEYDKQLEGRPSSQTFRTLGSSGEASSTSRRISTDEDEKGQGDTRQEAESSADIPDASDKDKLTNRLGSELIWAASLLINLRLFDFADGVLAKQLFFYGARIIQFIYLRAVSLYLRQREDEALRLIREAIELDGSNGKYWALEGHCYYVLGSTTEAMESYEKALKLPHTNENRHLLYLRYGSLVLDNAKTKLAKRVFLHGVSKYPSPYMWLALGSSCFQRLEYDQAESAFSEANRLDSTNPITWGHLALSSLMQDKKSLAEQAYKWALRFGLKKGHLLEEIQRLQREKGFGDPSFPRVPSCIPHDYLLRRMGKTKPFNLYKEGLYQNRPMMERDRFEDTDNELLMKHKLEQLKMAAGNKGPRMEDEWAGEDSEYFLSKMGSSAQVSRSIVKVQSASYNDKDSPPDLVTIKTPLQFRRHTSD